MPVTFRQRDDRNTETEQLYSSPENKQLMGWKGEIHLNQSLGKPPLAPSQRSKVKECGVHLLLQHPPSSQTEHPYQCLSLSQGTAASSATLRPQVLIDNNKQY